MEALHKDLQDGGTLVAQVMAWVHRQIANRQITPGVRLPSIRAMAGSMGVSKSTIVDAYDRLVAEGTIQSRPGSGFFVAGPMPPFSLTQAGSGADGQIDPVWMTRQSLDDTATLLKPGCGWLPDGWMPQDDMRRALRKLARDDQIDLTGYATPYGLPALRQLLARRLADHGIEASASQMMLTESGTQAIDLLCRFLVEPGDTVLVDDPCYFNFHAMLRAHRVKVVGVPMTSNGPDLTRFEEVLIAEKPSLYITNSAVHNPTGATLSPVTAHKVLGFADAHDLRIVEDDIFADFEHDPAPRLAAFDGLDRVIHIGSFSKTLSASVRCGFIAARQDWIDELVNLKLATSFGGGAFSADLVLAMLKEGAYRRHVGGLRTRLADAMGKVSGELKSLGLEPWMEPKAGMFLWCRLPDDLQAADVARHALKDGLVLAPGDAFSLMQRADGFMRFNVAQCLNRQIMPRLEAAMENAAMPG
jgi:DNA-binding transcriptional MocR family regulator